MTELIHGVNPLLIVRIDWEPAKRLGQHPYYYRLHKRKWKWLAYKTEHMFDFFLPASVRLYGPKGNVLLKIETHSNSRAQELCEQYTQQLEQFVVSYRRNDLLNAIAGNRND